MPITRVTYLRVGTTAGNRRSRVSYAFDSNERDGSGGELKYKKAYDTNVSVSH